MSAAYDASANPLKGILSHEPYPCTYNSIINHIHNHNLDLRELPHLCPFIGAYLFNHGIHNPAYDDHHLGDIRQHCLKLQTCLW